MVIDMVFFLVTAAAHWHAKKHHAQQTAAARQAAEHLRAAYHAAANIPLAALYQQGRRMPQPLLHRQVAVLRHAVPDLAEQILAEPGWPALAATLADAQDTGHNPATLLTEATRRRELHTADSISDVLVWRLRRSAHLPAAPENPQGATARDNHRAPTPVPASQPANGAANSTARRR